jgi:ankyrin repeat protein
MSITCVFREGRNCSFSMEEVSAEAAFLHLRSSAQRSVICNASSSAVMLRTENGRASIVAALSGQSSALDGSPSPLHRSRRRHQSRSTGDSIVSPTSSPLMKPEGDFGASGSEKKPSAGCDVGIDCMNCDLKDLQHFLYVCENLPTVQIVVDTIDSALRPASMKLASLRDYFKPKPTHAKEDSSFTGSPAKGRAREKLTQAEDEVMHLEKRMRLARKRLAELQEQAEKPLAKSAVVAALGEQTASAASAGAAACAPLLPPSVVVSRARNDAVLPMMVKVLSYNPAHVAHADEYARWMLASYVDQHAAWELFASLGDDNLLRTARLLVVAADPALVELLPEEAATGPALADERLAALARAPLAAVTASAVLDAAAGGDGGTTAPVAIGQQPSSPTPAVTVAVSPPSLRTTLPDFASALLKASSRSDTLSDLVLFLESEAVQCPSLSDSEATQIFFNVVCGGFTELLGGSLVGKRRWFHESILIALLGSYPNQPMIQFEFEKGVKWAALASDAEAQMAFTAPLSSIAESAGDRSGSPMGMAESSFADDAAGSLLFRSNSVRSASCAEFDLNLFGFPQDDPTETDDDDDDPNGAKQERLLVGHTYISRAPRHAALRPRLFPYYPTDGVAIFGDRAFAPLTDRHHVAVRCDTPVAMRRGGGEGEVPLSTAPRFVYFEVHAALKLLVAGDDCLRVGWCNEHFPANGRSAAMLGNGADSIGFSVVPSDVLGSVLRTAGGPRSVSAVTNGGSTASRFSNRGDAQFTAVKHFQGHSQRHSSLASSMLLVRSNTVTPPAFSFHFEESAALNNHQSNNNNNNIIEKGDHHLFGGASVALATAAGGGDATRSSSAVGFCYVVEGESSAADDPLEVSLGHNSMHAGAGGKSRLLAPPGTPAIDGDVVVIGCLIDTVTKCTAFAVNGVDLGVAFDSVPSGDFLYPCVSASQVIAAAGTDAEPVEPMAYFAFAREDLFATSAIPLRATCESLSLRLDNNSNSTSTPSCIPAPRLEARLIDEGMKLDHVLRLLLAPLNKPILSHVQRMDDLAAAAAAVACSSSSQSMPIYRQSDSLPLHQRIWHSMCALPSDADRAHVALLVKMLNQVVPDPAFSAERIELLNDVVERGAPTPSNMPITFADICPTPLIAAIYSRRRGAALTLAQNPLVNPFVEDAFGNTAALLCSALGYDDVLEAILRADPSGEQSMKSNRGYNPLHVALINSHESCSALLLAYAREIGQQERYASEVTPRCSTPLHLAARANLFKSTVLLLDAGATVDGLNASGATCLTLACFVDAPELALLLLSAHTCTRRVVNAVSLEPAGTALTWAAHHGQDDLVRALIAKGADTSLTLMDATPLIVACANGHDTTACTIIEVATNEKFASTANLQLDAIEPKTQTTALHLACEQGLGNVVEALLRNGAAVYAVNKSFATPVHTAAQNGHEDLAVSLLSQAKELLRTGTAKFDINSMDSQGDCIAHHAARQGLRFVMEAIVTNFSNDDVQLIRLKTKNNRLASFDCLAMNRQGESVLVTAIINGHVDIAETLITMRDEKAPLVGDLVEGSSRSVLEAACRGYDRLVALLMRRGAVVMSHDLAAGVGSPRPLDIVGDTLCLPPVTTGALTLTPTEDALDAEEGKNRMERQKSTFCNIRSVASTAGMRRQSSFSKDLRGSLLEVRRRSTLTTGRRRTSLSTAGSPLSALLPRRRSTVRAKSLVPSSPPSPSRPGVVGDSSPATPPPKKLTPQIISLMLRGYEADELYHELETIDAAIAETEASPASPAGPVPNAITRAPPTPNRVDRKKRVEVLMCFLASHCNAKFLRSDVPAVCKSGMKLLEPMLVLSKEERRARGLKQPPLTTLVLNIIRRYPATESSLAAEQILSAVQHTLTMNASNAAAVSPSSGNLLQGGNTSLRLPSMSMLAGGPAGKRPVSSGSFGPHTLISAFGGYTALQLAARLGHIEVCAKLLAEPIAQSPQSCGNLSANRRWIFPARYAVEDRNSKLLALLLRSSHIDVNDLEPQRLLPSRETLLHAAVRLSDAPCVGLLLDAGAKVNGVYNSSGDDVWMVLARHMKTAICEQLLEQHHHPPRSLADVEVLQVPRAGGGLDDSCYTTDLIFQDHPDSASGTDPQWLLERWFGTAAALAGSSITSRQSTNVAEEAGRRSSTAALESSLMGGCVGAFRISVQGPSASPANGQPTVPTRSDSLSQQVMLSVAPSAGVAWSPAMSASPNVATHTIDVPSIPPRKSAKADGDRSGSLATSSAMLSAISTLTGAHSPGMSASPNVGSVAIDGARGSGVGLAVAPPPLVRFELKHYQAALLFTVITNNGAPTLSFWLNVIKPTTSLRHLQTGDTLLTSLLGHYHRKEIASDSRSASSRSLGDAALLQAVNEILLLPAAVVDINASRQDGATALFLAAKIRNLSIVEALLNKGATLTLSAAAAAAGGGGRKGGARSQQQQALTPWRAIAQCFFSTERVPLLRRISDSFESPATRRGWIAAVLPNAHPIVCVQLCSTYLADLQLICASLDAVYTLWISLLYSLDFSDVPLRQIASRKQLETIVAGMLPTAPPLAVLATILAKRRVKPPSSTILAARGRGSRSRQSVANTLPGVSRQSMANLLRRKSFGDKAAAGRASVTPQQADLTIQMASSHTGTPVPQLTPKGTPQDEPVLAATGASQHTPLEPLPLAVPANQSLALALQMPAKVDASPPSFQPQAPAVAAGISGLDFIHSKIMEMLSPAQIEGNLTVALDLLELSSRYGCVWIIEQIKAALPASIKFREFVGKRCCAATAAVCGQLEVMRLLLQTHHDVAAFATDTIDPFGVPVGLPPPVSSSPPGAAVSAALNSLQQPGSGSTSMVSSMMMKSSLSGVMSGSLNLPAVASTTGAPAKSGPPPPSSSSSGRKSHLAAAQGATANPNAGAAAAVVAPDGNVEGSPFRRKEEAEILLRRTDGKSFSYTLYDWLLSDFLRSGFVPPRVADCICFFMDQRIPLSHGLFEVLAKIDKKDESAVRCGLVHSTAALVASKGKGVGGEKNGGEHSSVTLSINMISPARGDSLLHILVIRDQVELARHFLSTFGEAFCLRFHRNQFGLMACDYTSNPKMIAVLAEHSALLLGNVRKLVADAVRMMRLHNLPQTLIDEMASIIPHSSVTSGPSKGARKNPSSHHQGASSFLGPSFLLAIVVPRDVLHLLDSDNIALEMRVSGPTAALGNRQTSGTPVSQSAVSTRTGGPPGLATTLSSSMEEIPGAGLGKSSGVSDDVISRNQAKQSQHLKDVFLPKLLSLQPSQQASQQPRDLADGGGLNRPMAVSDLNASVVMLPALAAHQAAGLAAQRKVAKEFEDFTNLIRRHGFGVKLLASPTTATGASAAPASDQQTLFITLPFTIIATMMGLCRPGNPRVPMATQVDQCAAAVPMSERARMLAERLQNVAAEQMASLGLVLAPSYN